MTFRALGLLTLGLFGVGSSLYAIHRTNAQSTTGPADREVTAHDHAHDHDDGHSHDDGHDHSGHDHSQAQKSASDAPSDAPIVAAPSGGPPPLPAGQSTSTQQTTSPQRQATDPQRGQSSPDAADSRSTPRSPRRDSGDIRGSGGYFVCPIAEPCRYFQDGAGVPCRGGYPPCPLEARDGRTARVYLAPRPDYWRYGAASCDCGVLYP